MRIEAVIFDMDGLMLDTEPFYKLAWQRAALECGFRIEDELWFELMGSMRAEGEDILLRQFGSDLPLTAFRKACRVLEAAVFEERLPEKKPGLDDLLALLDSRGVPRAVATSTDRQKTEVQLGGHGLLEGFKVVATGDQVAKGKPAPDLFLLASQGLGVEPRKCLVLEDSEAGVIGASRAEMPVYLVPDVKAPRAEVEALAQGKFHSLLAVARHLERLWVERPWAEPIARPR
jgi:HAD superfamily hydrolase (TIGR01509 family)